MRDPDTTDTDRGQAYTLEGFIAAMVVLMALLFALQSVVITPTTGGMADRTVQSQVQQETQDALMIAADGADDSENMSLSETIRYWDDDEDEFYNADPDQVHGAYNASNDSELYTEAILAEVLTDRFTERGMSYNVELVYQNESEYESEYLVYQGEAEAITTSYTVTLYENQTLTAPGQEDTTIDEADHPIPRATDDSSVIYNVVEVRVAVW